MRQGNMKQTAAGCGDTHYCHWSWEGLNGTLQTVANAARMKVWQALQADSCFKNDKKKDIKKTGKSWK
jgi:hypothetical protein